MGPELCWKFTNSHGYYTFYILESSMAHFYYILTTKINFIITYIHIYIYAGQNGKMTILSISPSTLRSGTNSSPYGLMVRTGWM